MIRRFFFLLADPDDPSSNLPSVLPCRTSTSHIDTSPLTGLPIRPVNPKPSSLHSTSSSLRPQRQILVFMEGGTSRVEGKGKRVSYCPVRPDFRDHPHYGPMCREYGSGAFVLDGTCLTLSLLILGRE